MEEIKFLINEWLNEHGEENGESLISFLRKNGWHITRIEEDER